MTRGSDSGTSFEVTIETVDNRTFASVIDWPGWSRSGRREPKAVDALVAQAPRYALVARRAGFEFPGRMTPDDLHVVERVAGDGSTSFGVPGKVTALDLRPATSAHAGRLADLLRAAWEVLAEVAAGAPEHLRKGPRGGGCARDEVVRHVEESERSYARSIGLRPARDASIEEVRAEVLEVLRLGTDGAPLPGGTWPLRYAARRFTWHVLDHAWEIEDKSEPDGSTTG